MKGGQLPREANLPLFGGLTERDKRDWLCLLLALGTFVVFLPVLGFQFTLYDDPGYVLKNEHVATGVSLNNLRWALTTLHGDLSYWHPLTWVSHQLDCQLFGLSSGPHHLTSVVLHSIAGVLLFLFLHRTTGRLGCSALVAALFCLHPLHVESVAWISERKDVLTAVFWFATLLAYAAYVRERTMGRYLLVLLFFGLDLMAKPSAVTLPFVLLLMDYWPLGRLGQPLTQPSVAISPSDGVTGTSLGPPWKLAVGLVVEKIPLFVLSAAASVAAFVAQRELGAMSSLEALDRSYRVDNTLFAYATYLLKTFWPTDLAVIYSRMGAWPFGLVLLAGALLAAVSYATWRLRRSHPYLLVGWLWFLGVLVPMIGIVQVGAQWMADRYTYISIIGLFIMIAWGGAEAARRLAVPNRILIALGILVIGVLVPVTRQQLLHWENSRTLFTRAVAVTQNNWLAQHNLGLALANEGKNQEADFHLQEALRITPRNPTVNETRARVYLNLGDPKQAAALYREVIAAKPDYLEAHRRLAWIYATSKDPELRSGYLALEHARLVSEKSRTPESSQFDVLAAAYAENGQFDEAVTAALRACALAEAAGEDPKELRQRLELYQSGQPYRSKFEPAKRGQIAGAEGAP